MDMTSGGWDSSGEELDEGREGGTLSDGEGRNKGSLDERRGGSGERDYTFKGVVCVMCSVYISALERQTDEQSDR